MNVELVRNIPETNSSSSHILAFNKNCEKINQLPSFLRITLKDIFDFYTLNHDDKDEIITYFYLQAKRNGLGKKFLYRMRSLGIIESVKMPLNSPELDYDILISLYSPNEQFILDFIVDLCVHFLMCGEEILRYRDVISLEKDDEKDALVMNDIDRTTIFKNGNYYILIERTFGTNIFNKYIIKLNRDEELIPSYPDQIDLKISGICNHNCPFCHEVSINGDFTPISKCLNAIRTSNGGFIPEVCLGGGNVLMNPDLRYIINILLDNHIFVAITVNYKDLLSNSFISLNEYLKSNKNNDNLSIGISLSPLVFEDNWKGELEKYFKLIKNKSLAFSAILLHVIDGIMDTDDIIKILDILDKIGIRPYIAIDGILVLGYKEVGKGKTFKLDGKKHIDLIKLHEYIEKNNIYLALACDEIYFDKYRKKLVDYIEKGDNSGGISILFSKNYMYLDLVDNKFWINSNYEKEKMFDYEDGYTIEYCFRKILKINN